MKLKNNKIDLIIEVLCLIMLVGTVACLIVMWDKIPNQIPAHYDALGQVDRWEEKGGIVLLPIIEWILYLFITLISLFPQAWNTGVKVTEENKERVYRTLKYMIQTMKLIMIVNFTYLVGCQVFAINLPVWYTVLFMLMIFGDIAFWLVRLYKVQ